MGACGRERTTPTSHHVGTASASASATEAAVEPLADPDTWKQWAEADYLALASKTFHDALAPLVAHRTKEGHRVASLELEGLYAKLSSGKPTTQAVSTAIERLAIHSKGKLRFVLLVGDAPGPSESHSGWTPVPAHYLPKLEYEHHGPGDHDHPLGFLIGGHAHDGGKHTGEKYPSDHPYAQVKLSPSAKPVQLAVGRLPVRTVEEASAFVRRIVAYETTESGGTWQRRLVVTAGPASYGAVADSVIETVANGVLDTAVPYDFDLAFTFAKLGSPYAYRFDKLQDHFVDDLSAGALIATYVGHGAADSFDDVHWRGAN